MHTSVYLNFIIILRDKAEVPIHFLLQSQGRRGEYFWFKPQVTEDPREAAT